VLITLWTEDRRRQIVIVVLTAFLVLAIGVSRLYLGVHYFSDVVGGFAAGLVWLAACISGVEIARRRATPSNTVVSQRASPESGRV
ncbi:MAG: phosphatase PAP2 family protein, partial [Gemmatimonadota bacterium]|nr:phosphatase PAP2 family protein [Gemmatimonadota bacterium]